MWSTALLFGVAYLATRLMIAFAPRQNASAITGLTVLLTIPFAARMRKAMWGFLYGLALGFVGSLGIATAVMGQSASINTWITTHFAIAASSTLICCALAGALFGHLAARRHRQICGD